MANANPYLILRRIRDSVIKQLRQLFDPSSNLAVPNFKYPYIETAATGYIQFFGNPENNDTLTIGTIVITFVTGAPVGNQVQIGASQVITQANLVAFINAHSSTLLVTATTNTIPKQINLKAITTGSSGNSLILAVSSTLPSGPVLRVSAPTLTQGGLYDFDNSQIFIGDVIPADYQDWPAIVVDTQSVSETRYLGPEDEGWTKNTFGVVTNDPLFSSLIATVNINLYIVDDTIARDEIIDLIYNNISIIRDRLAENGIEMIDRTFPAESRVFQDQRWFIENHFTLRVYAEWTDTTTITNVSDINITIPLESMPIPVINSPISYSWAAAGDIPFSYQITATNQPISYGSTTLPTGLNLNPANGLISGTPSVTGTFYITLNATNATGTGTLPFTLTLL